MFIDRIVTDETPTIIIIPSLIFRGGRITFLVSSRGSSATSLGPSSNESRLDHTLTV